MTHGTEFLLVDMLHAEIVNLTHKVLKTSID
jgi:hypothetical protein